jgi:hypothetical protein
MGEGNHYCEKADSSEQHGLKSGMMKMQNPKPQKKRKKKKDASMKRRRPKETPDILRSLIFSYVAAQNITHI